MTQLKKKVKTSTYPGEGVHLHSLQLVYRDKCLDIIITIIIIVVIIVVGLSQGYHTSWGWKIKK